MFSFWSGEKSRLAQRIISLWQKKTQSEGSAAGITSKAQLTAMPVTAAALKPKGQNRPEEAAGSQVSTRGFTAAFLENPSTEQKQAPQISALKKDEKQAASQCKSTGQPRAMTMTEGFVRIPVHKTYFFSSLLHCTYLSFHKFKIYKSIYKFIVLKIFIWNPSLPA